MLLRPLHWFRHDGRTYIKVSELALIFPIPPCIRITKPEAYELTFKLELRLNVFCTHIYTLKSPPAPIAAHLSSPQLLIPDGPYKIRVAGVNTENNLVTAESRGGIRGYNLAVKAESAESLVRPLRTLKPNLNHNSIVSAFLPVGTPVDWLPLRLHDSPAQRH